MPKIYRAMKRDEDGKPKVGPRRSALGVKPGSPPGGDIPVDADGRIVPRTGGMSVAPTWQDLPPSRIPKRLKPIFDKACGSNGYACWFMGSGPFEDGAISEDLSLHADKKYHGMVEPAVVTEFDEFQAAIAATRDHWQVIVEDK